MLYDGMLVCLPRRQQEDFRVHQQHRLAARRARSMGLPSTRQQERHAISSHMCLMRPLLSEVTISDVWLWQGR